MTVKTKKRMSFREWLLIHTPAVVYTHPFEIAVAICSFLVGLTLVIAGAGAADSGLVLVPLALVKVWQLMMLIGGPLTLAGLFWFRDYGFAQALERAGVLLLASAWGTRGIILLVTAIGLNTYTAGLLIAIPLYMVIAISCQIRATVIKRALTITKRVSVEGR